MDESKKRVFVLGIDGVPYSLLNNLIKSNICPNLKKIIKKDNIKEIKSVYPVISSVAWTGYATGTNPGNHGIFGFVDRLPQSSEIYIPTSKQRRSEAIWTTLSKKNKRVVVINVPITYPVEEVNGKMISCFLCPDINKGVYPKQLTEGLKENGYIIDVNAMLARTDKKVFLEEVFKAMDARFKAAFEYIKEEWDYFQLHIMETDRLMHFFWHDIENENSSFHEIIVSFWMRLDNWIGELLKRIKSNDSLIILSDHGFCGIKYEVQLNKWLKDKGYLVMKNESNNVMDYSEESICYSLLPGRIFINLKGREEKGSVKIQDYDKVREKIRKELLNFKNIETGENIIKSVYYREEIYDGGYVKEAADIIAHPNNGYDLKGNVNSDSIFTNSALTGMHTYDDAVIIGINFDIRNISSIIDVRNELLSMDDFME